MIAWIHFQGAWTDGRMDQWTDGQTGSGVYRNYREILPSSGENCVLVFHFRKAQIGENRNE